MGAPRDSFIHQRTFVRRVSKPPQATLNGANCCGAQFNEANMVRSSLAGATLAKANFAGANLTDTVRLLCTVPLPLASPLPQI